MTRVQRISRKIVAARKLIRAALEESKTQEWTCSCGSCDPELVPHWYEDDLVDGLSTVEQALWGLRVENGLKTLAEMDPE